MCDSADFIHLINEDSTFVAMARLEKSLGGYPALEDIDAVTVSLFDITAGETEIVGDELVDLGIDATPSVASVFFATLQTGAIWKADSVGYNLRVKGRVPQPDRTYRFDVFVEFANGDQQKLKFVLRSK